MSKTPEQMLTAGLMIGYASEVAPPKIARGGFAMKQSHIETPDGVYHDEWLIARNGGGQEFARTDLGKLIRSYVGGVAPEEILTSLGITETEITKGYLIPKLKELEGWTRLDEACKPEPDGSWQYGYEIIHQDPTFQIIVGLETVHYNNTPVFLHVHTQGPILE